MFILSPVIERAVFFVLSKAGLFRRCHVCKFIIERSEPESSWNFTVLLKILTVTYLSKFPSLLSPDCVCLILFLGFLDFLAYQQRITLRPTLPQFLQVNIFFSLDKTSPSVGHHRYNWWWIFSSIRTSFVVNIWSHNFTFLFLWEIASRFALDFLNMSNSRFLNSFRVTFNEYYPLAILSHFF